MNERYDLPAKVFVVEDLVQKPPFYIVEIDQLLKYCGNNYVFIRFEKMDVLLEN
jgi:hypothetical protein